MGETGGATPRSSANAGFEEPFERSSATATTTPRQVPPGGWLEPSPLEPVFRSGLPDADVTVAPLDRIADDALPAHRVDARAAARDKGPIWCHLSALGLLDRLSLGPRVNVMLILDGEEEVGSPCFGAFAERHRELLAAADLAHRDRRAHARDRTADGRWRARGIMKLELGLARQDLHSGNFAVPNPAWKKVALLASMATPDGAPLIEGQQADVIGPTAAGRRMMVDIPLDTAGLAQDLGTPTPAHLLGGLMFRPTLTIRGLQSGFGARIRPRHRSSFRWHGRSWPRWSARTGRAGRPVADGACPSSRSPTSWVCRRWLSQTLMPATGSPARTSTCGSTTSSKASAPPRRFSGTWPEHGYRPRGSAPTHGARGSRGPSRMTDSAASAHRDPRALTAAQTESYDRLDYLSPLVAMPPSGAQAPRWKLEVVEASRGRPSSTRSRTSSARISSCWSREFFIKDGYDSSYVSWHQDSTSWRLSYPDVVTALARLHARQRRPRLYAGHPPKPPPRPDPASGHVRARQSPEPRPGGGGGC